MVAVLAHELGASDGCIPMTFRHLMTLRTSCVGMVQPRMPAVVRRDMLGALLALMQARGAQAVKECVQ